MTGTSRMPRSTRPTRAGNVSSLARSPVAPKITSALMSAEPMSVLPMGTGGHRDGRADRRGDRRHPRPTLAAGSGGASFVLGEPAPRPARQRGGRGRPARGDGVPVIDRRLLAESRGARRQLVLTLLFGCSAAVLLLAQAGFLADVLADVSAGRPATVWRASLGGLAVVVVARALVATGAETTALRAAENVRADLRGGVVAAVLRRGPAWLGRRPSGQVTALLTRGLDAVDVYIARFLPSTALAVIVPPVVLVRIGVADWLSALILVLTAPLVPVFMA